MPRKNFPQNVSIFLLTFSDFVLYYYHKTLGPIAGGPLWPYCFDRASFFLGTRSSIEAAVLPPRKNFPQNVKIFS